MVERRPDRARRAHEDRYFCWVSLQRAARGSLRPCGAETCRSLTLGR